MCKRFQDCGFLGNKAVSNCIHTWPLWQWDVSAICKSNCNKIGVINVTLLLPPPTMPHVCVWLSLEVCQWTVRIWKWMIKELYCGLLTQSPLSVSQGLLFSPLYLSSCETRARALVGLLVQGSLKVCALYPFTLRRELDSIAVTSLCIYYKASSIGPHRRNVYLRHTAAPLFLPS